MSRTFRRKNYPIVKELRFNGYRVFIRTDINGHCDLPSEEIERIYQKDFHDFHSDKFHFNNRTYERYLLKKQFRKGIKREINWALRNEMEENIQVSHFKKYGDSWMIL